MLFSCCTPPPASVTNKKKKDSSSDSDSSDDDAKKKAPVKATPTTKPAQQPVKKPASSSSSDSDDDKPTNKKPVASKGIYLLVSKILNYTYIIILVIQKVAIPPPASLTTSKKKDSSSDSDSSDDDTKKKAPISPVKSTPTTKPAQQPVKKPAASSSSDSDDSDDDKPTNKKPVASKGIYLLFNMALVIYFSFSIAPVTPIAKSSVTTPVKKKDSSSDSDSWTGATMILVTANSPNVVGGVNGSDDAPLFWDETAGWGSSNFSPFQQIVSYRFGTTQSNNLPVYTRPRSIGSAPSLTTMLKNGVNEYLYVNGGLVYSQGGKLAAISGTSSTGWLGAGYHTQTYFAGDIAEVLVYNAALSNSDRQQVEQYLLAKYGISQTPVISGLGVSNITGTSAKP